MEKMSLGEMLELSKKEIPVSEDVYVRLAGDTQEYENRNKFVKKFGYYSNVTFLSNGAIHTTRPGAIGYLRVMAPMIGSPDSYDRKRRELMEKEEKYAKKRIPRNH